QLDKEARRFPRSDALMFWQIAGVSHLVVHKHDLGKRARGISRFLQEAPERYQLVTGDKEVDVYRLLPPSTAPELLTTPALPQGATPITPRGATAKSNGSKAGGALDQAPGSSWRAKGLQREGQWFQIDLGDEQDVVALEFADHANVFDAPRAWRLELSADGKAWTTAQEQVNPALFAEQIHTPASFVFRVVLPEARRARYLRLSLLAPSQTSHWVVHTARVWAP
ncbi:MAG: discoidin domain-containing protein, partial [Myxococcota bacterium]|nr:discoidin domain-containing protein [Myxococcota bacterium]